MEDVLWKIFKKTGDIKYYLFLKEIGSEKNGNNDSRGNGDKRKLIR